MQINGTHLLALINDVLDLSKIEAGELSLALEDYSIRNVVDTVVVQAGSLAQAKGLSSRPMLPTNLPKGLGDERRLTQVLLNLVSNAIKFTEKGSVDDFRFDRQAGTSRSQSRIPAPASRPRTRRASSTPSSRSTTRSTRKKGGTGLGLAISKRSVEMHGGTIDGRIRARRWLDLPSCGSRCASTNSARPA